MSDTRNDEGPASAAPLPAPGLAFDSRGVLAPVERESAADALLIVESYGPWGADLNDAYRRQIVLADEVKRLREALLSCARKAEALKQQCGSDPESQQAMRNAQYQAISTTAHTALGAIFGARLLMPKESIAMLWNSLPIDLEAEAIVSFVRGVERWHGLGA